MSDGSDPRPHSSGLRVVGLDGTAEPIAAELQGDEALVRDFLAGRDDAFGELVRRYQGTVLALLRRYADDHDDAQDLAQRAFLRAFEAARRSLRRGDAPFRAWLYRIAVNLGRNHVRDLRRWRRAPAGEAERLPVAPQGAAALERAQRSAAMRAAVLRLPRRQREVLTLRLDGELPFKEIALALGITENNAKVHFHHAARRLREALAGGELA